MQIRLCCISSFLHTSELGRYPKVSKLGSLPNVIWTFWNFKKKFHPLSPWNRACVSPLKSSSSLFPQRYKLSSLSFSSSIPSSTFYPIIFSSSIILYNPTNSPVIQFSTYIIVVNSYTSRPQNHHYLLALL